jgi:hypothetical protein
MDVAGVNASEPFWPNTSLYKSPTVHNRPLMQLNSFGCCTLCAEYQFKAYFVRFIDLAQKTDCAPVYILHFAKVAEKGGNGN